MLATIPLAGCATLPERVAIPAAPPDCTGSLCRLAVARIYARDTEAQMIASLAKERKARDVLRGLSFVGLLTTAAATTFGAGRDLTVGLGLGTGALAIGSSLTGGRGYASTYLAAADAAACVHQATATVEVAARIVEQSRPFLVGAKTELEALTTLTGHYATTREVAVVDADLVLARANEFDLAGAAFASRSESATYDIVTEARRQIAAQEPDEAAFREAMSLIGALAVPPSSTVEGRTPTVQGNALVNITDPSEQDRTMLLGQQDIINRRKAAIEEAIARAVTDAPAQLVACGAMQQVAAPRSLTVSGAPDGTVTLGKDMNVSLVLNGGEAGYRGTWVGAVPKDLTLSQQGNTIDITAGGTLEAGRTYLLRVRDLATNSQSRDIAVVTQ